VAGADVLLALAGAALLAGAAALLAGARLTVGLAPPRNWFPVFSSLQVVYLR